MKLKVKLVSLVLVVLALVSTGAPAFAATVSKNSGMQPMLINTDFAYVSLNFSGDKAECFADVLGKTGTTKITGTLLLKRVVSNGTVTVKSWSGTAYDDELYFGKTYYVSSGYTYILQLNANVTKDGTTEFITLSDSDYCG